MKEYIYIDENEDNSSDNTRQSKFKVSETSKIDYLINESKYDEALTLIEKTQKRDAEYWKVKGVILYNLKVYERAIECFDNGLKLGENDEIKSEKAKTLYEMSRISFFPEMEYRKALALVDEALEIMPDGEDASEYYFLKSEILEALDEYSEAKRYYLMSYGDFEKAEELERQREYISSTTDTLISIAGIQYYDFVAKDGLTVNLVKEQDNEHDGDAIAVYLDGEKIGYVANSPYTLFEGALSATQLKNRDLKRAQILFSYLDRYTVAKLLDSDGK